MTIGQGHGEIHMGGGRLQAKKAAPDQRLTGCIGQVDLYHLNRWRVAQLIRQCLFQQQSRASGRAIIAGLSIGFRGQAPGRVIGRCCLGLPRNATVLVNQLCRSAGHQPDRRFEDLRIAHIEPDAARQQLNSQRAADQNQRQLAEQGFGPQAHHPPHQSIAHLVKPPLQGCRHLAGNLHYARSVSGRAPP